MGFTAQHQEMIGRHHEVKAQRECEKKILKELIVEKFPNSGRDMFMNACGTQNSPVRLNLKMSYVLYG